MVPAPRLVQPHDGPGFAVTGATGIRVAPDSPAVRTIGKYLTATLGLTGGPDAGRGAEIVLMLADDADLGEEGYVLTSAPGSLTIRAAAPAGLFRGAQTLRQLWPETASSGGTGEGGISSSVDDATNRERHSSKLLVPLHSTPKLLSRFGTQTYNDSPDLRKFAMRANQAVSGPADVPAEPGLR